VERYYGSCVTYREARGRKLDSLLSKKVRRNAGNRETKFLEKAGEFVNIRPAVRRPKFMEVWCAVWFWTYGRQMSQRVK
jgi:hypothetical protein